MIQDTASIAGAPVDIIFISFPARAYTNVIFALVQDMKILMLLLY